VDVCYHHAPVVIVGTTRWRTWPYCAHCRACVCWHPATRLNSGRRCMRC
jgi:hypothetical protein